MGFSESQCPHLRYGCVSHDDNKIKQCAHLGGASTEPHGPGIMLGGGCAFLEISLHLPVSTVHLMNFMQPHDVNLPQMC